MNASTQTNSRNNISGSGSHTISVECYSLTNLIGSSFSTSTLIPFSITKSTISSKSYVMFLIGSFVVTLPASLSRNANFVIVLTGLLLAPTFVVLAYLGLFGVI
jgi:hypothetical protein